MEGRFYKVPWCVPELGAGEIRAALASFGRERVAEDRWTSTVSSRVASLTNRRFGLCFNRGRTAIQVALQALDVRDGHEVILPSYICVSAVQPIIAVGAKPVFVDIDQDLQVSNDAVLSAITTKTKAVLVPHLFGVASRIDELEPELARLGVWLIDDAAQSFGARRAGRPVGSFGTVGIVASGPGKSLTAPAGGVLLADDLEFIGKASKAWLPSETAQVIAGRLASYVVWRRFRAWTMPFEPAWNRYFARSAAYVPSRMSNLDAALAACQINSLDTRAAKRRTDVAYLVSALAPLGTRGLNNFDQDSVALKAVLILPEDGPSVSMAMKAFASLGIECQPGYRPCHQTLPGTSVRTAGSLSTTESLWRRVLCLPTDAARLFRSDSTMMPRLLELLRT